jgi:hypothetical protein
MFFSLHLRVAWPSEAAHPIRAFLTQVAAEEFWYAAPAYAAEASYAAGTLRYSARHKDALRPAEEARAARKAALPRPGAGGAGPAPYRGYSGGLYQLMDAIVCGPVVLTLSGYLSIGVAPPATRKKLDYLLAALAAYAKELRRTNAGPASHSIVWTPESSSGVLDPEELGRLDPALAAL